MSARKHPEPPGLQQRDSHADQKIEVACSILCQWWRKPQAPRAEDEINGVFLLLHKIGNGTVEERNSHA